MTKNYILLDEIQFVDNFVGVLSGFLHMNNVDVYVSGSNINCSERYIFDRQIFRQYQYFSTNDQYNIVVGEYSGNRQQVVKSTLLDRLCQ